MDPLEQLIKTRYPLLPQDIQKYVVSQKFTSDSSLVAKNNGLTNDQIQSLDTEITLVLFAAENPADFIRNVKEQLGVDADKARKIANDVNENVFRNVRQALKEMFATEDESAKNGRVHLPGENEVAEERADHILTEEEKLADPNSTSYAAPLTGPIPKFEQKPITAPLRPIKPIETLENDIKNDSILGQKLNKPVGMPKEEKKFTGLEDPRVDAKNTTKGDPYREPF